MGANVQGILEQLATTLAASLCDGCSVLLLPGEFPAMAVSRHRAEDTADALAKISALADPVVHAFDSAEQARATLPPAYWPYVERFGLRGLGILPFPLTDPIQGVVTVTRDGNSAPFEPDDITTIETCIEYAALAVQTALRFDAERAIAEERQASSQYQQQMLSIVGHDLRNPLHALSLGVEMLEGVGSSIPSVAQIVRKLDASAKRMTSILDLLLDVTRVQLGQGLAMSPTEVKLLPLARATVEELSLAYPNTTFELVDPIEVTGIWDPGRLSQALSNLMSNAAQYGRTGTPVQVRLARGERTVTIAVSNTNRDKPIPPELIKVLFDPYKRGHDQQRHHAGLGLGLYIVHQIVQSHGGRIEVESIYATTTFRITLPLRP
jgi:signal transduction histidine kinase